MLLEISSGPPADASLPPASKTTSHSRGACVAQAIRPTLTSRAAGILRSYIDMALGICYFRQARADRPRWRGGRSDMKQPHAGGGGVGPLCAVTLTRPSGGRDVSQCSPLNTTTRSARVPVVVSRWVPFDSLLTQRDLARKNLFS